MTLVITLLLLVMEEITFVAQVEVAITFDDLALRMNGINISAVIVECIVIFYARKTHQ